MFINPNLTAEPARDRQRELLADAKQRRLVRELQTASRPHGLQPRGPRRVLIALAVLTTSVLAVVGCGSSPGSAPKSAPVAASTQNPGSATSDPAPDQPTAETTAQPVDLQQGQEVNQAPANNCPDAPSLAHCFSESSIEQYLQIILPMVDKFYQNTWQAMPLPANVYFVPDGATMQETCTDGSGNNLADDMTYAYCAADDNVYIGQKMAWDLYSQAGDIAPAIGIAHEFGHDVQTQTGVPAPQTDAQTLTHEDQADCVSGAWFSFAAQQGWLEQEDVPSTITYLHLIASSESDPNRTHGDFQERQNSFGQGVNGGIKACDTYYSTLIYDTSGQ
jgi:predicted metalloprotease